MANQYTSRKFAPRDPWTNKKLIVFVQDKIGAGILNQEHAHTQLVDAVMARPDLALLFPPDRPLTKQMLHDRFASRADTDSQCNPRSMIWTKTRSDRFDTYYKHTPDDAKLAKRFDYLPLAMIKNRIRWLRGKGVEKHPVKHVSGLFRVLPSSEKVSEPVLLASTLASPIVISDDCAGLVPLVSLGFGLPYSPDMRDNVPRCAMETCVRMNYAVVIAGGLIHLDVEKAGLNAHRRARMSASDIDPAMFPPAYRKRVKEIVDEGADAPIFMTLLEQFNDRLAGIAKIFRNAKKQGAPARFAVPTYFMLTASDRAIIERLAYYEVRYQWLLEQRRIAAEVTRLGHLVKVDPENEELALEYKEQLEILDHSKLLSHVSDDNRNRATDRMTHYYVQRILESIPNAQYVGMTDAYFSHRGQSIAFMEFGSDKQSPGMLDVFIRTTLAPRSISGQIADRTVLIDRFAPCGDRSLFNDTRAKDRRFVEVIVPPPTCDIAFLKAHMLKHGLLEGRSEVERFVLGKFTEPGMYALLPSLGLPSVARYEVATLRNIGGAPAVTHNKRKAAIKNVTFLTVSDLHVGNTKEEHVRGPGDAGKLYDMTGALLSILRGEGARRVHAFFIPDDIAHGANHEYHVEPDSARLSVPEIEKLRETALDHVRRTRSLKQMKSYFIDAWNALEDQILKSGIYRIEEQRRKFLYLTLLPHIDVIAEFILSHARAKISFDGPSRILGTEKDLRDLPAIMFGNGNHHANSGIRGKNDLSEGYDFAEIVKQAVRPYLGENVGDDDLGIHSRYVGAPLLGQNTFGCARLSPSQGVTYGIAVRGSPARYGNANGYGLVQASANEIERGNYNNIFHGVSGVLAFYGDRHKTGQRDVPGYRLIQCGTFATEDAYSHHGFARVHNAAVLVSVPASGPSAGPMVTTFIPTPWIAEHIKNGTAPDWSEIIPAPL